MSRKKQPPKKEELEKLYSDEYKSPNELCVFYSVSRPCILRWLEEYNIRIRNHSDASKIVGSNQIGKQRKNKLDAHKKLSNYDWLYNIRVIEKLSQKDIGELIGCSEVLVKYYLEKHNIENFRTGMYSRELLSKENISKLYDSGLTMREVADELNVSLGALWPLFKKYDIIAKNPNDYDRSPNRVSKAHQEIVDFIKTFYSGEIRINDRTTVGTELDIYIPEHKYAIEYNGLFYHNDNNGEEGGKNKYYHLNKTIKCEMNEIFLFHIWEDIWKLSPEIVKSMIRNKMGFIERKLFARKCKIIKIPSYARISFFRDNHIQGEDAASQAYGLVCDDELVACMSFSKSRFNNNYKWELVRYANKINTIVVGGFSRLLKYFRKNNQGSIISYSDRCYASGDIYKNNGFELLKISNPDYMYVDYTYSIRFSKRMFRKKNIQKKYDLDMSKLTENEAMKLLGFKKIWNCGTISWILQ